MRSDDGGERAMTSPTNAWAMATWDATETASRVARGETSAREVLEAAILRAEATTALGGIASTAFAAARGSVDAPRDGVFAGVPTFVKDLAQAKGMEIAWGSKTVGVVRSKRSDPFVRRLESTGVVVLGKSTTPEFGLTATTEPVGGIPARNPWDPTRTAGGSSGGAGVLVAAGVVPLAHGSDGGGSIRIPAACCGLVGLKPSRGVMDMEASPLLPVNVAVHGVLTRTVRDTAVFHRALGRSSEAGERPARRLRIGVFVEPPAGTPVHPDVRESVLAASRTCRALGHSVDEIPCPFEPNFTDAFLLYWRFIAWIQVRAGRLLVNPRFDASKIEPWTRGLVRSFEQQPKSVASAILRLRAFGARYAEVFERYDVLVSPTVASPALPLGVVAPDGLFDEVLDRLRTFAPFTPIQNAAGAPAISLPLGRSGVLPVGVQLAAARGRDALLLELAAELEQAMPWERHAPVEAFRAYAPG